MIVRLLSSPPVRRMSSSLCRGSSLPSGKAWAQLRAAECLTSMVPGPRGLEEVDLNILSCIAFWFYFFQLHVYECVFLYAWRVSGRRTQNTWALQFMRVADIADQETGEQGNFQLCNLLLLLDFEPFTCSMYSKVKYIKRINKSHLFLQLYSSSSVLALC